MVRPGMAEVELVEHDDAPAEAVDHVDRARGVALDRARGALAWVRRHRVLAAATVAGTVLAVVVPAALSLRAERARTEALAAFPGVLAPMPSAPEVAWTMPVSSAAYSLMGRDRAWIRDDVLVSGEQTGDSTSSLRAVDVRTGEELWTAPLTSVPDLGDATDRVTDDPTTCSAPAGEPGVVVCLVVDAWQLTPATDDTRPDVVEPSSVRLRSFDATSGEVLVDEALGQRASFAPVGPDVVVVTSSALASATGPASLVRLDPSTGSERWSADVRRPVDAVGSAYPLVRVLGDEIGVGWLGTTALFTGDGDPAGQLDTDDVWPLRGHRIAPEGDGVTQLRDLDTGRVLLVGDAWSAWLATDDGSAPDLLMLQSAERLTARDVTTGHRAWQLDWPVESTLGLVVVDGMLARQADDGLTVVDLGTGEQLWRRSVSASGQGMVTDGRRLLVLESVVGTGRVVAAYDARDGRRVWEAPIPLAVQSLAVVDHRLFALGSEGIVAFEPS